MQKYISTAVFSILLFVVIIFTSINYHNNNVLESRINTITKYSKDLESEKSFKEDYYILQQSHDTNLILLVFSLMVAVIGFFTYQNIVAKFDLKASELKNEINDYKTEWQESIEELGDLQVEFYLQAAELCNEFAEHSLASGDKESYLQHSIASVSKTADLCMWFIKNNEDEDNIDNIKTTILDFLKILNKEIDTTISIEKSSLIVIENFISSIRKIESKVVDKELSLIHSKLKEKK